MTEVIEELPNLPLIKPKLSINSNNSKPIKKIFIEEDIKNWLKSETFNYLGLFINRLTNSIKNKSIESACFESNTVKGIIKFLENATNWVDDIPLQTTPQRFGNKSFRTWIQMLEENEVDFQLEIVPLELQSILPELSHHFRTSFGSAPRLDYGTGHELSFLAYLLILRLVGILTPEDEEALVNRVFVTYLKLVRKLQFVYKLEPAGSKGVWGLDDHQHLVYLFGSSQLLSHPTLRPSSILSPANIAPHAQSYLYLSSILHISTLKSGPFAEHSPMLHNIASTVPNWSKVNNGLLKMYVEEVLKKVPVIQHFWFGEILGWRDAQTGEELSSSGDGKEGEVEEEGERQRDEGTVAPWSITTSSSTSTSTGESSNSQPVTKVPWTSSFSSSSSSSSSSNSSNSAIPYQRQTTYPTSSLSNQPTSFKPPPFFPSRISSGEKSKEISLAEQGGAAASSSVFGVLKAPTLSSSNSGDKKVLPWDEEK